MDNDEVTTLCNSMLALGGEWSRDLADVLHYHKVQTVSGSTSTAYKIYAAELSTRFSQLGEMMLALGDALAG